MTNQRKRGIAFSRREFLKGSAAGWVSAALGGIAISSSQEKADATEVPSAEPQVASREPLRLWYLQPATRWDEALPIGNGRLGAMVFGQVQDERLQINEQTLWAGGPHDYDNPDAKKHLSALRELIFNGEIAQADQLAELMLGIPSRLQPYQPFCDLKLLFPNHTEARGYLRELDLERAIVNVRYRIGGALFTRAIFCSYPEQALVAQLACSQPGQLGFDLSLASPQPEWQSVILGQNTLKIAGQLGARVAPKKYDASWNGPGLKFEGRLQVRATGGEVSRHANTLQVRGANSATLIFAADTSYKNYKNIDGDPASIVEKRLAAAAQKSFERLRKAHVTDYQKLFRRVSLSLGSTQLSDQPTDIRIKNYSTGNDPQLAALYFQFGRYLLISSSRPGGLPANLQGIWNQDLWPAWGSKWTSNINVEMNYWPAEVANLPECHGPLLDLVDSLRAPGRETARVHYGCDGFVLHHNTDLWRATAPCDGPWGVWPMGAVWLATHFYEHYEFSGDLNFLRERAYPVMKEAARFVLDFLVEAPPGTACPGAFVTNPSFSPENSYRLPDGSKGLLTYACSMDLELIQQLFRALIETAKRLGVDLDFRDTLQRTLRRLPPLQVGKRGQLQEWIKDYEETDPHHRHCSHLYGLFPGSTITLGGTPKLAAAARKSLELRGDGSTGWSRAWRICLWARLRDDDHAHQILAALISERTLPSMLNLGPPFQIDGNFGGAAGIAEMLLQSHEGEIHLLPALPAAWPNGSASGLCARGGFEVGVEWKKNKLKSAMIFSRLGNLCRLRYGERIIALKTHAGANYQFNGDLERRFSQRGVTKMD